MMRSRKPYCVEVIQVRRIPSPVGRDLDDSMYEPVRVRPRRPADRVFTNESLKHEARQLLPDPPRPPLTSQS